jgi:hypothetical protein
VRKFWTLGLAVSLCLWGPPTRAETAEERLEKLLDGLEETALWVGNYHQTGLTLSRWTHPIQLSINGYADTEVKDLAVGTVRYLAELAGVEVDELPPGAAEANFIIDFQMTDAVYAPDGARGTCLATNTWDGNGNLTRVKLTISTWAPNTLKLPRCVRHEALHGMGLLGHPHELDSILSYVFNRSDYTENDVLLLKLLYSLKPGSFHIPALMAAREELARRLGVPPEGAAKLGGKVFEKELARLTEAAEKGAAGMQVQLGVAYAFGQYVSKQPEKAVTLFRMAAEQDNREGQFRLAYALANGNGVAKDPAEAARFYNEAARRGHATARANLGLLYRDGNGVAPDPVTAWALLDLAASQGNPKAAEQRDAMALSEEQKTAARARQANWLDTRAK